MAACSKTEQPAPTAGKATPDAASPSASVPFAGSSAVTGTPPGTQASTAGSGTPDAAAAAEQHGTAATPGSAPASFKGGTKENIASAVGLGCEATSLDGFLQLLCRKKNGTGGHPVRAVVHTPGQEEATAPGAQPQPDADAQVAGGTPGLTPNEQGELTVVVPYAGDEKRDVTLEWTDTTYTLHVTGPQATLEWAGSGIPHRRACQQVLDETKAVISGAQKLEGEARLTTTEASKLPRFGVCQPGGLGSWAIALKAVGGKGEGAARTHHFELEVVRIALDGARKSAPFGVLDVAPGGLTLAALQVYDFDDDGRDELIVPYELKAAGTAATAALPPPIWSFSDAGVAAYAKAPQVVGGIGVEQLDFDMRPDFSGYGGFVAYLGPDCGIKTCPPRLTGPKLFLHATPEGGFTDSDEAARSALKRASCQNKPNSVVVESGGSLNAAQTAHNLVCAKAYGVSADTIVAELSAKHAALCGDVPSCALQSTLEGWAKQTLPVDLSTGAAAAKTAAK
jgi:hypothetical protein